MPNASEKLFKNRPSQTFLPLNPSNHFHHGLCWFADKDGNLPDAESIWQNLFEASEEEIAFSDDKTNTRKTLAEYNLFGVPFWVQQMPLLLSRWALRLHENPAPFQPAFCR